MKPFDTHINEYDEKGRASEIEVLLANPEDVKKAQQIMAATGVPTELDAVIMVFRRYQPDFLNWWNGDITAAPMPLSPEPPEAIRQEHEGFLSQLEALAVEAIATDDWGAFNSHVWTAKIKSIMRDLRASTKSLTRSGADLSQTTQSKES